MIYQLSLNDKLKCPEMGIESEVNLHREEISPEAIFNLRKFFHPNDKSVH
jgi:hypothetical protein